MNLSKTDSQMNNKTLIRLDWVRNVLLCDVLKQYKYYQKKSKGCIEKYLYLMVGKGTGKTARQTGLDVWFSESIREYNCTLAGSPGNMDISTLCCKNIYLDNTP